MARPLHNRPLRVASVAALLLGAQGCVDPDARYEAFVERTADLRGQDAGGVEEGGERFDFSGSYLLALSTTLAPGVALLFGCEVTVAADLETLDLVIQPLTADTTGSPREPTGDSVEAAEVRYEEGGTFTADLGEVMVPGDANPISGSPIVASVTIAASVFAENDALPDHFCGQGTGMVTVPVPLDLTGSTFGAVQADSFAETEPLLDCPE